MVLKMKTEKSSTRFTGATGRAYLFNKVVNVSHSAAACRIMLTGRHIVSTWKLIRYFKDRILKGYFKDILSKDILRIGSSADYNFRNYCFCTKHA